MKLAFLVLLHYGYDDMMMMMMMIKFITIIIIIIIIIIVVVFVTQFSDIFWVSQPCLSSFPQLDKIWAVSRMADNCYNYFISRLSVIVWVNVILNRTVVVDSDWRFDNLSGSHLQSQSELYHVSWWY